MARRNAGTKLTDRVARAMFEAARAIIESAGDVALEQARERLAELTQTNCGWIEYEARPLLAEMIRDEQRERESPRLPEGESHGE